MFLLTVSCERVLRPEGVKISISIYCILFPPSHLFNNLVTPQAYLDCGTMVNELIWDMAPVSSVNTEKSGGSPEKCSSLL